MICDLIKRGQEHLQQRSQRELKTINPATEEIINRYEIMTMEQIDNKVKKAQSTLPCIVPKTAKRCT